MATTAQVVSIFAAILFFYCNAAAIVHYENVNGLRPIRASAYSLSVDNPIRRYIENKPKTASNKTAIILDLGDLTKNPLFSGPPPAIVQALITTLASRERLFSYAPSAGTRHAREAVGEFVVPHVAADKVVITSGTSEAINFAIRALADTGDNILIPCPGFPLYRAVAALGRIETRCYNATGAIDLDGIARNIDALTRAIVVNNPSNPTGAVLSLHNLRRLKHIARRAFNVTIIADEIYGALVYNKSSRFHPIAAVTPYAPVIACSGLSKSMLMPGARIGYMTFHDRHDSLSQVIRGVHFLTQISNGPNVIVQESLRSIFQLWSSDSLEPLRLLFADNLRIVGIAIGKIRGLALLEPQGAFYAYITIDAVLYGNDVDFNRDFLIEENVSCLPGSIFQGPNGLRIVLFMTTEETLDFVRRLSNFCRRNRRRRRLRR